MEIKGGCLCGAVRYTAEADPTSATVCHRRDCQKFTGPDRLLDLRISDYQEPPTLHVSAARRAHPRLQDLADQFARHRVRFQPCIDTDGGLPKAAKNAALPEADVT
jgi:hypothetical protein